jgi:hypothetical protein
MPELPATGGLDLQQLMAAKIGPVPVPLAIAAVVGGVGYLIYKNRKSAATSANNGLGNNATPPDPNIDPTTGVPWDIERMTNPNTGLPNYYGGPGIDTGSNAGGGGSGGPINEIPPNPGGVGLGPTPTPTGGGIPPNPGGIGSGPGGVPIGPLPPLPTSNNAFVVKGYKPGDKLPPPSPPVPGIFPQRWPYQSRMTGR